MAKRYAQAAAWRPLSRQRGSTVRSDAARKGRPAGGATGHADPPGSARLYTPLIREEPESPVRVDESNRESNATESPHAGSNEGDP
jgi:hypothetical protein